MKIILPGKPIPQIRHRHRRNMAGKIWIYDPLAREKELIRRTIVAAVQERYPDFKVYEFPDVAFKFYMPVPKYLKKFRKEYAKKELLRHTTKPDVDNLIKLYLDCLVKIIMDDDKVVKILEAVKLYSFKPRVEITIVEGTEVVSADKQPHGCHDSLECDTPNSATMDVPPYSEAPYYSDSPQLSGMCDALKNRAQQ